ncbi:MAG: cyclophilin-like fold protein [Promethearchaeota archaeon]
MAKKMKIITNATGEVIAELSSEKNPKTVEAIWVALPFETSANTWGDEIYFSIPVEVGEERAQETVEMGDLGYWPPGNAMCIFFGPTPMSRGNEIRPASPVNVFGKISVDPKVFKKVRSGSKIRVEKAE